MEQKGLNQKKLSKRLNVSQSTVSRIMNQTLDLDERSAMSFARNLGGSSEKWQEIYEETTNGTSTPLAQFLSFLSQPDKDFKNYEGLSGRRLFSSDIKKLFSESTEWHARDRSELCEIENFSEEMLKPTSYDTRIGWYAGLDDDDDIEIEEDLSIAPHSIIRVATRECFHTPSWLEADVHPAASLACKGLIVSNGPIIDPDYNGYLTVSVFNPTDRARIIEMTEPFLTIRFTSFMSE